jgi:hypothetical protein
MLELNKETLQAIRRELGKLFLSAHSFDLTANGENGEILKVVFRDNPNFRFLVIQPSDQGPWKTVECPGVTYLSAETYEVPTWEHCRSRIQWWVDRILKELTVTSGNPKSELDTLRKNLEQYANSIGDPDTPFSNEESEEWKARLDGIVERLEKLESQDKIQSTRLQEFKKEIDALKERANVLPKRTWIKAAGYKILDYVDTAVKAGVKAFAEATVKGFLPGNK